MGALLAERLQKATPQERHRTVLCTRVGRERERVACNGPPFEVVDMSLSAESKRLKYLGNGVGSTKSLLFLIPTI